MFPISQHVLPRSTLLAGQRFTSPATKTIRGVKCSEVAARRLGMLARTMSTTSDTAKNEILTHQQFGTRTLILNRPYALNALNLNMVSGILAKLREWSDSELCNVIVLKSNLGKAFCAGGDVVAASKLAQEGNPKALEFLAKEYQMDHYIATYQKPIVSLISGITLGGGVGISMFTPFRVATETTMFAMPETQIGFFPDVAASYFLPKFDGQLGRYLGLTGARLTGIDVYYAGIATHYVPTERLPLLEARLQDITSPSYDSVNKVLEEFVEEPLQPGSAEAAGNLTQYRGAIDRCFAKDTVEEIVDALNNETEQPEWAQQTLKLLSCMSPTSLKVTLQLIQSSANQSLRACYETEYQLANKFLFQTPDFHEGIRAQLITKTRDPKWSPATLEEVKLDKIRAKYFSNPDRSKSIKFLTKANDPTVFPFKYALPTEKEIRRVVRGQDASTGGRLTTANTVIEHFDVTRGFKVGVREKVAQVLARKTVEKSVNGISTLTWQD